MPVSDLCQCFQVCDIGVRVSESLDKDCFRVLLNRRLESSFFLRIHKGCRDAACQGQSVCQQVVGSPVDGPGCYDMLTRLCQRLKSIGDGCRAGGCRQCRSAPFQSCDPLFEYSFCRVGQPSVYVSRISEREQILRMSAVVKYKRCRRIDRNRPCACCRVWLFLSDVQLLCLKAPVFRISYICHGEFLPVCFPFSVIPFRFLIWNKCFLLLCLILTQHFLPC